MRSSEHWNELFKQRAGLRPVALEDVEHTSAQLRQSDRVSVLRLVSEPDGLGRMRVAVGESAELGQVPAEPVVSVDQWRCAHSKVFVDPIGGQRCEVAIIELDCPFVLTSVVL